MFCSVPHLINLFPSLSLHVLCIRCYFLVDRKFTADERVNKIMYCQKILLLHFRNLHISAPANGQAKVFKKIMGGGSKKKFKYCETPLLQTPTTFSKGVHEGKRSSDSKRATVLNKLFMRYITDLMATGECSSQFLGHGIEINQVKITPDFNCVNVYWIAKGTEKDDVIEDILKKNTGGLRHELAQLKVVGVIPKIRFVKDKQYAQAMEVDKLLMKADYGDDYIPIDITSKLKAELELNVNLEPHIIKKIHTLDNEETEHYEEPLPPMTTNVFGLNYSDIMERIQKSTKKSLALHRLQPEVEAPNYPHTVNKNPLQFNTVQEEREAFREFLEKRQILKRKADRTDKNYSPELEYINEEWLKQQETIYNSYDFEKLIEDGDFIDEDDHVK